jgi:EAL domain-containing protein (putative c-di-GMP-specific phosphodiesterase class I)
MGRNMDMEVVAEGVETREQLEFLRARGCHYAQGRLFGDPMTAADFLALLEKEARGELALPLAERRAKPRISA